MEGTQAIKDFLALPMSIHMAVDRAKMDGKVDLQDLGLLIEPAMKVPPFVAALGNLGKEFADLDAVEKQDVYDWAKGTYDIADDKVEEMVEKSLKVALEIAAYLGDILSSDDVQQPVEGEGGEVVNPVKQDS